MTAPGAHFEFYEGPGFRQRTRGQPNLVQAIEAHVRQRFDRLERLGRETLAGELDFEGQRFGFVVIRLGSSRLCLQQVWNADSEALDRAALEAALERRRKP